MTASSAPALRAMTRRSVYSQDVAAMSTTTSIVVSASGGEPQKSTHTDDVSETVR